MFTYLYLYTYITSKTHFCVTVPIYKTSKKLQLPVQDFA